MEAQNLFEEATRRKLRFTTSRGDITVEDLWDLPLQSQKGDFDLDSVAKLCNRDLKATEEESFVKPKSTVAATVSSLKLEVVKHVIATKMKAKEEAETKAKKQAQAQIIMAALERKQNAQVEAMSMEELQKALAELSG